MKCISCGKIFSEGTICPNCGQENIKIINLIQLSNIYYNNALDLANDGKISGAIEELKKSIGVNKKNIDALNLLGLCYFKIGRYTNAFKEWIFSTNVKGVDNEAIRYLELFEKNEKNIKIINSSIDGYNKALELVESNNKLAIMQLQKVINISSDMIDAQLLLALLRIKEKDYIHALRGIREVLRNDAENETALMYLAEVEKIKDRFTLEKIEKIKEEAAAGSIKNKTSPLKDYSVGRTALDLLFGILIGIGVMLFLVMPAIRENSSSTDKNIVLDQNQQISDLKKQLEDETAKNKNLTDENKTIKDENESNKATIEENKKLIGDSLYESGISSFESKKYSDADKYLKLAIEYNDKSVEIYILYLRTKLILGDMEMGEKLVQEIQQKFPNTKEARRAVDILDATKRLNNGQ